MCFVLRFRPICMIVLYVCLKDCVICLVFVLTDLWFYINQSKFSLHFTKLNKTESAAELNWVGL